MKLLALLLLCQSLTLSAGEERQSKVWRTWAPRWDVFSAEVTCGPVVANVTHKRGVAGLNADRRFPTASFGVQRHVAQVGPWDIKARAAAYVDFGHVAQSEKARWTPAAGLWASAPIWGLMVVQTAAYVRGPPRYRENRGQQSPFRGELKVALKLGEM